MTESVEDAPASVTIISYQELKAMAYPTVAEAVRGRLRLTHAGEVQWCSDEATWLPNRSIWLAPITT